MNLRLGRDVLHLRARSFDSIKDKEEAIRTNEKERKRLKGLLRVV